MAELALYHARLPCVAHDFFAQGVRDSFFLRLKYDDQTWGVGEFAPLPLVHNLGVDELLSLFKTWPADNFFDVAMSSLSSAPWPLSYMLSMAEQHRCLRLSPKLYDQNTSLSLAALVSTTSVENAILQASGFIAQGFNCLKLKIGSLAISDEIKKIEKIAAIAPASLKLRLDANRRLNLEQASVLLKGLKKINIEYLEEPLANVNELKLLREQFDVKLAIDESQVEDQSFDLTHWSQMGISHIIIKPSLFANLKEVINLVGQARTLGLTPIFSHCYESDYHAAFMALMLAKLDLLDDAHGIMVHNFFKESMHCPPLRPFRGKLSLSSASELCLSDKLFKEQVWVPL